MERVSAISRLNKHLLHFGSSCLDIANLILTFNDSYSNLLSSCTHVFFEDGPSTQNHHLSTLSEKPHLHGMIELVFSFELMFFYFLPSFIDNSLHPYSNQASLLKERQLTLLLGSILELEKPPIFFT